MPLYSYTCSSCGLVFDDFSSMKDDSSKSECSCGNIAVKNFTVPNLRTDTSFFATGGYDNRVCASVDDKIEGRKDWERRLEKKGLVEIDQGVMDAPPPKPKPFMD